PRRGDVLGHVFVQVPALALIERIEHYHELAVDILRCAVRPGGAFRANQHRAHQARGDVALLVDVGVIQPEPRARLARLRPRARVDFPGVRKRRARLYGVDTGRGFVVPHTVRVDAEREVRVVLEHHLDGVADLAADHGPEHAEMFPAGRPGLQRGERRV